MMKRMVLLQVKHLQRCPRQAGLLHGNRMQRPHLLPRHPVVEGTCWEGCCPPLLPPRRLLQVAVICCRCLEGHPRHQWQQQEVVAAVIS